MSLAYTNMKERITDLLEDVIKIELTGEKEPFLIFRGTHPDPGESGYPWEDSQEELLENRLSVFPGLNRYTDPERDWCEHYVLENTTYEKVCDLMLFFDFGMDHFLDPINGNLLNSNEPGKMRQRREAAAKFLVLFKRDPISILSLTSDHIIFASKSMADRPEEKSFLAEASWNHNKAYYPRPRNLMLEDDRYSVDRLKQLAKDHSVFSIGWDDA